MKLLSNKLTGHILASITILVWGTTFIASKILLSDFTPIQVMIIRFIIAYITLLLLNHKLQKTSIKEELIFLLLAVLGATAYFFFENEALTMTYASNVSILLSVTPLLTAILAHFFTKDEKMNAKILLGSFIAFAGVILVVFNGTVILQLNPLGNALILAAALSWAVYSLILKKYINKYNPIYLTRKIVFYSIITTLPLLLIENKPIPFEKLTTTPTLLSFLFLGVLGSGICYVTWNIATIKIGTVTTNNYIYLSPFVTMVTATLLINESITLMGALGAILIIVGVTAAGMKKSKYQNYEIG